MEQCGVHWCPSRAADTWIRSTDSKAHGANTLVLSRSCERLTPGPPAGKRRRPCGTSLQLQMPPGAQPLEHKSACCACCCRCICLRRWTSMTLLQHLLLGSAKGPCAEFSVASQLHALEHSCTVPSTRDMSISQKHMLQVETERLEVWAAPTSRTANDRNIPGSELSSAAWTEHAATAWKVLLSMNSSVVSSSSNAFICQETHA